MPHCGSAGKADCVTAKPKLVGRYPKTAIRKQTAGAKTKKVLTKSTRDGGLHGATTLNYYSYSHSHSHSNYFLLLLALPLPLPLHCDDDDTATTANYYVVLRLRPRPLLLLLLLLPLWLRLRPLLLLRLRLPSRQTSHIPVAILNVYLSCHHTPASHCTGHMPGETPMAT